uniref:Uncharacterized protein n=1 Tax=Anguilla anguilla TaxID=7936 RepID=A0A0E9PF93_ANGAN
MSPPIMGGGGAVMGTGGATGGVAMEGADMAELSSILLTFSGSSLSPFSALLFLLPISFSSFWCSS